MKSEQTAIDNAAAEARKNMPATVETAVAESFVAEDTREINVKTTVLKDARDNTPVRKVKSLFSLKSGVAKLDENISALNDSNLQVYTDTPLTAAV